MIATSKNRKTGTTIELGHQDDFGMDNGADKWITYCQEHEQFMGHDLKRNAIAWAARPDGWCDGCSALI